MTDLGLGQFVAIDLETTGITAGVDEIIEIGVVRFVDGIPSTSYQRFVNPDRHLSPFIVGMTGITDDDLKDAPRFAEVHDELLSFIGDDPIVGQNINFDLSFLSSTGGSQFRFPGRLVIDTAEIARIFWAEFPRFSLASLCYQFGVHLSSAHRAGADARATGEILVQMVGKLPDRVWSELTEHIASLCGAAHHRAELFFEKLQLLSRDIPLPISSAEAQHTEWLSGVDISSLGQEGIFETSLQNFSPRKQQLEMAAYVHSAFEEESILLLEAPTGTGKSLGYLVPALQWVTSETDESPRQVVISSHTRSLQEQLLCKEISDISRVFGASVPAAVLKGRDNYLCKRRLRSAISDLDGRLSDGDRLRLLPLLRWSSLTMRGDIGEIGGFRPEADPLLWSMVCSDAIGCAGARCGAHRGDFHRQALDQAKAAKLLLINHALLATDFDRFIGNSDENRRLIIDEAHQFERAVVSAYTESFGFRVVRNSIQRLTDERAARGLLLKLAREIKNEEIATELILMDSAAKSLLQSSRISFQEAADALGTLGKDDVKVRILPDSALAKHLEDALVPFVNRLDDFSLRLGRLLSALTKDEHQAKDTRDRVAELNSAAMAIRDLLETGKRVISADDDAYVYWLECSRARQNSTLTLFASPISVADTLESRLWNKATGVLLTSATLAQNGEFGGLENSLGLSGKLSGRVVARTIASPFDLEAQMRCYCPSFLPAPQRTDEHLFEVSSLIQRLVQEVSRSCLILCTSHASAESLAAALLPTSRALKRPLFHQSGGRDAHEIVRAFRESENGILIGSSSLWEGIDLVGDALEMLVVVKLPFDVPTDPWVQARSEFAQARNENPFETVSIPACVTRLRQGLGRLIRHTEDRGIAIIADTRLVSTRYGRKMQDSLPVSLRVYDTSDSMLKDIQSFFESGND